jgi:hypothetical protein
MAAIDFPNSPIIGQSFTVGEITWTWTGVVWKSIGTAVPGPTGPAGANGTNGTNGLDGADGANGLDGAPGEANFSSFLLMGA